MLLPGVAPANTTRLNLVQQQRKVLFFDQKNGEVPACTLEHTLPDRLWVGLLYRVLGSGEGAGVLAVFSRCSPGVLGNAGGLLPAPDCSAARSVSAHGSPSPV